MPPVQFLHDRHTEALKGKRDCTACHLQKDQQLVFKYQRLEDGDPKADMAIYHTNCIGCHTETAAAGQPAGPVAGDCRTCHRTRATAASARQPIAFDKSLHYRHESAPTIRPTLPTMDANCSACHHQYDKEAQKTVYVKGEESSCQYCHKEVQTKEARSLKAAAHDACLNCHRQSAGRQEKAGPLDCRGCHDLTGQQKIERVETVPRLKRNQPDVSLLASWTRAPEASEASGTAHMAPVAFNHLNHEGQTESCKTCHHASLEKCSQCHTETGTEKGGAVTLEQAMHHRQSDKSCLGCHAQAQSRADCAGCHATMGRRPLADATCHTCHAVDKAALTFPIDPAAMNALAQQAAKDRRAPFAMVPPEQIPETVTINAMADQYEAVAMPHRKIVQSLAVRMEDDRLAGVFHREGSTLCLGCHHNSPATTKPPKCAACHGEPFKTTTDGRPGLLGAYHGQCISCHQAMQIEKPAATDCTACHKPKAS
ncbi:MAG: cytochrome c3 family protein [Desulfobacteraceae bacterium]|nr:cytochrome c3 family protein [Desulfobacteraceae bacterium]